MNCFKIKNNTYYWNKNHKVACLCKTSYMIAKMSVYMLIYTNNLLLVTVIFRILVSCIFRIFEMVARYCEAYNSLIPVAFVLGFYVSIVISRWWEQFNKIPWPDRMALFVMSTVSGQDERGRLMRRTIMRYLCLSYVITTSSISPSVKKRFPTFEHMTEAGAYFMVIFCFSG